MAGHSDGSKYKLTLSIEVPLARKFAAFAAFKGDDQSAIISRLIRREMRGFSISHKPVDHDQAEGTEGSTLRLAGQAEREAG